MHPADGVDHVHAEGAAGAAGAQDGGLVLADPVARPGMRAVENLFVRGVEHFERRHHLPGGHGVDLERAVGNLSYALDEVGEVLVQGQAGRPGGLHFQVDDLLSVRCACECCGGGQCQGRACKMRYKLPHDSPPPRLISQGERPAYTLVFTGSTQMERNPPMKVTKLFWKREAAV